MEMLTGNGYPSKRLKGEIGQHYEDLDTGDIFELVSANEHSTINGSIAGGYIWKKVARGDHMEVCVGGGSGGGTSTVVVLEETTVTGEGEIPITTPFKVQPKVGKTYKVTYNGTPYDCPGVAFEMDGVSAVALGNTSALGIDGIESSNAEAPFMMLVVSPEVAAEMGSYGAVMDMSGATSITLSITYDGAPPETGPLYFYATATMENQSSGSATTSIPFSDVLGAIKRGRPVYCELSGATADTTCIMPAVANYNDQIIMFYMATATWRTQLQMFSSNQNEVYYN